jgi:hypothetical protein
MRMTKSFLGFSLFLLLPSLAHAGVWGTQTTITGYYVYDDGAAFIKTAAGQDPQSCGSTVYYLLDTTKPNFKAIWAQVISAQATGATVSVYFNGCEGAYPKVAAIAVPQSW